MNKSTKSFRASAIPSAALRRLRSTPSYFLLFWRWSMWIYALGVFLFFHRTPPHYQDQNLPFTYENMATLLLTITFIQTLAITLYAPVFHATLSRLLPTRLLSIPFLRNRIASGKPYTLSAPLQARNARWDVTIYTLDVIICGLIVYYSGPFSAPPFGVGSPFYRYGMSTAIAAAITYRYRGGLAAALGFDLFIIIGMIYPAPGAPVNYVPNIIDIAGSLIDAPIAAILAAYMVTLLGRLTEFKKQVQEQSRHLRRLARANDMLKGTNDPQELIQRSTAQIRRWGNFDRLVIMLIMPSENDKHAPPEILTCIEAEESFPGNQLKSEPEELIQQVLQTGQKRSLFVRLDDPESPDEGIARLYLLQKEEHLQIVIGAESKRSTPFKKVQEAFLQGVSEYLIIALDNIRLTARLEELATVAERGRIAREIHDGVAQLIYMLSLHAETCEAQVRRIAEASEEDEELLTPLAERLNRLVTIAKQALWETRNYMFSLKPMISGTTSVTQMLTNQIREFETISNLPTTLSIEGNETLPDESQHATRRYAQIGTALFRIVQESLTNAYKHSQASKIDVYLHFHAEEIKIEVSDNGRGLPSSPDKSASGIYSGRGLNGMQERVQELGGTCNIDSRSTGGVSVHICIPLAQRS